MKKQEKAGDVPLPLKATHKLKLLKYLAINTSPQCSYSTG
jgi:hypothetical protein